MIGGSPYDGIDKGKIRAETDGEILPCTIMENL